MTEGQPTSIEEFLAQQARERELSKAKSSYFSYGVVLAVVLTGLPFWVMVHTNKTTTDAFNTVTAQRDICQAQAVGLQRTIATQNVAIQAMTPRKTRQAFTVLYDSSVTPANSGSDALTLLNLVRPGLGTLLGKLSQSQTATAAPAWFIPANVKPVFYGDVARAVVVTIDANNQVISSGNPLSLQQVQANPSLLAVQQ